MNTFRLKFRKILSVFTSGFGWRILRFFVFPSIEHNGVIKGLEYDVLIDVGANRGQFSLLSKILFPSVPIFAFEPLASEAAVFRRLFSGFNDVILFQNAVGDQDRAVIVNVSKAADSSSVLPISQLQSRIFPGTEKSHSQTAEMKTLKSFKQCWSVFEKPLSKIDVQGFEFEVLLGIGEDIKMFEYIYVETSGVEFYSGQKLFPEIQKYLIDRGFFMVDLFNEVAINGAFGQADVLFKRKD